MQPGWIEKGAWTLGITLMLTYGCVRTWAETSRSAGVRAFEELRAATTAHPVDQSLWSAERVAAFARTRNHAEVPIGVLRIPALRLEAPVYEGTGEINLNRGAGRIPGTAALGVAGNAGIAAHRDGFFRSLQDARVGQILYLDTPARRIGYRIVETRIVEPTDLTVLAAASHPTVTLVTCYPFYFVGAAPMRFIVRAEAVTGADLLEASSLLTLSKE